MPVTTLNNPLNVNQSGPSGAGASGGGNTVNDLSQVTDQVKQQTAQFTSLLKDPNETMQSEQAAFFKLQREVAKESMIFQTLSNVLNSRVKACENAIRKIGGG